MSSDGESWQGSRSRKMSPTMEDDSYGGSIPGESLLKKGPWTSAEDAILVEYVTRHGEGNWNNVQKHSGLSRCGKSCRLRWANHLRPDLKKGAFTPEEEDLIIELHAKMGNKWARMAAELPGRTDNEIKNYWNTRIKRLQRAGLPIYPPEFQVLALNDNEQAEDVISGSNRHSDSSQNAFDIPDVEFKNLGLNQGILSCSGLLDIPNLQNSVGPSQSFGYMFPEMNPYKRLREMETGFHDSRTSTSNSFLPFDQYNDDGFARISSVQPLWSSTSYDHDLDINQMSPIDICGSHTLINGNSSSSKPNFEAMKLELPSLQYSTSQVDFRSLESVDTVIQSPESEHTQPNCPSPRSSGLLEAIVYESQSMNTTNQQRNSEASVLAGDGVESSSRNVSETKWDACGDPVSPLSQSAASVFVDPTLGSGGSSSDEPQSVYNMKPEPADWSTNPDGNKDISCPLKYLRPDALLDSFWFGNRIAGSKEGLITDDVGIPLGEDLSCEFKQADLNQIFGPRSATQDNH